MTSPQHYINIVLLVLLATGGVAAFLYTVLLQTFLYNPYLNGVILAVFLIGIGYALRRIWQLRRELRWIAAFRTQGPGLSVADEPILLSQLETLLGEQERRGKSMLSTVSVRYLLDSVQARLDEQRDNARYLTGLLIFLGLLGTFWGLLQTIGSVGDVIQNLSLAGDTVQTFDDLKAGLAEPLGGMGTAFSSSLFGLAGSLVLGFLDLQASRAQSNFFNDLEEWLATLTSLSSAGAGMGEIAETGRPMPSYFHVLLERTVEATDRVAELTQRAETSRLETEAGLNRLIAAVERMTGKLEEDGRRADEFAASAKAIENCLRRLEDDGLSLDERSRAGVAEVDRHLRVLIEDLRRGRADILTTLKDEVRLVTRTIAVAAGEPEPR